MRRTPARERALPAARRSIRSSANAIRAIHRLEFDTARTLIGESRAALDEGLVAVEDHADIRHAGYLQDAQKEYAEANLTLALVTETDLRDPTRWGSRTRRTSGSRTRSAKGAGASWICCGPATSSRPSGSTKRWRRCTGSS